MNRRVVRWLARRGVRRSNLRGSLAHRLAGNRLFARELWAFTRHSVRNGWIIGSYAATTPFMGAQILGALPLVFILRANLFVTIALILLTNPLTIAPYLGAAYWVGTHVTGGAASVDGDRLAVMFSELGLLGFIDQAWRDWGFVKGFIWTTLVGGFLIGTVLATVGATAIHFLWKQPHPRPAAGGPGDDATGIACTPEASSAPAPAPLPAPEPAASAPDRRAA